MPAIDRIKTEVYFTDANGVEREVVDARRRSDGRLWKQYPGCADAQLRYFVLYQPRDGLNQRAVLEVRKYRFRKADSRWFQADLFQEQFARAERRES